MVIDTKSQLISNLDRVECYLSSVNEELYNAMGTSLCYLYCGW